jgi:hypothetical protein
MDQAAQDVGETADLVGEVRRRVVVGDPLEGGGAIRQDRSAAGADVVPCAGLLPGSRHGRQGPEAGEDQCQVDRDGDAKGVLRAGCGGFVDGHRYEVRPHGCCPLTDKGDIVIDRFGTDAPGHSMKSPLDAVENRSGVVLDQ